MTLLDDCVFNNRGADTGLHPHGVPTSYDWYWRGRGTKSWLPSPPGWTSLTGWSTVFPNVGKPNQPADAFIFVRNLKVYVHPKVGRGWTLVQNQGVGGHRVGGSFFEALVDGRNAGAPGGTIQIQPDGSAKLAMPRQGVTFHFWIDPRGVFPANSVNAVYATMEVRADRPNANLITQIGADWWINPGAGYAGSGVNNREVAISDWSEVTENWKTFQFCHLTRAELMTDLPPPLVGGGVVTPPVDPPPVVDPPVTPPTGALATLLGPTMPIHTTGRVEGDVYNIWSNGKLAQMVTFPAPPPSPVASRLCKIRVEARGSIAQNTWPTMEVIIDDKVVATRVVDSATIKVYEFNNISAAVGAREVGARFTNDGHGPGAQDRNLYIKRLDVFLI